MDDTKESLKFYIKEDMRANGGEKWNLYSAEIKKYLRTMRKCEYLSRKENFFDKLHYYFLKFKFHKLGIKLGFELPLNHHIGSGIRIDHWGFLAINYGAKIGKTVIFMVM